MAHWLIVVDPEEYERQRMYASDTVPQPSLEGDIPADGDEVLLAATGLLFGAGRVDGKEIAYTHRMLEEPVTLAEAAPGLAGDRSARLDEAGYAALRALIGEQYAVTAPVRDYLVSVSIPVEASSPAEAARIYWSYVASLGPAELPAFVAPYGDELSMQAYVLGAPHEMDPEEEDEDED